MLFNSHEFIFIFLPLSFFIYFFLNSKRLTTAAKSFLLFSSLVFYSWWNINYLPLILCSILFNYSIGNLLSEPKNKKQITKKTILIFGILSNLTLLGYFKYMDFFISNINFISNNEIPLLHLALPLAISFFTFQQIAYLVDSYRGLVRENDFLNYAVFVSFFPQLIAGPIVHHKEMMPQFSKIKNKVMNFKHIFIGLFIFSIGLFKKIVIADTLSIWANKGYDNVTVLNTVETWATTFSYTFQIYFDFSGYTDMAIGAALLFNIKLPTNFHSPYKATNIQDFWKRWHITLSRFLREYIYIPLGGNKKGTSKTFNNILVTFILGGLWHGPAWTFIIWGLLHAMALIIYKLWQAYGFKINIFIAWFLTFNFINISWIFFRAESFNDALYLLKKMIEISSFELLNPIWMSTLVLCLIVVVLFKSSTELLKVIRPNTYIAIFTGFIFMISLMISDIRETSEFLYFQF